MRGTSSCRGKALEHDEALTLDIQLVPAKRSQCTLTHGELFAQALSFE
jgi:hypothetical protein